MATAIKKGKGKKAKKATRQVTRLEVLIDESGSMEGRKTGVIEGYNEFMDAMKAEDGELFVSLTMFDSRSGPWVRRKFEDVPIADVTGLGMHDYSPYGGTPLNDALFETLESLGTRLGKDEQAIVVVMTDGEENQSRAHRNPQGALDVKQVIKTREKDGWVFIYLGAAHDVWAQSGGLGFAHHSSKAFSGSVAGTSASLRTAAMLTNTARAGGQDAYLAASAATPDVLPDGYLEGQDLTSANAPKQSEESKSEVTAAIEKAKGAKG